MIADCEKLNIAPASGASSTCGVAVNEAPPGYGLCKRGFEIFNPGATTSLVDCLATIGVQDECHIPPLQVCVDKTFADECVIASIGMSCDGIKTTCGADPFDAATCARVRGPAGLDIGAANPAEIALAIAAQMTAAWRGKA